MVKLTELYAERDIAMKKYNRCKRQSSKNKQYQKLMRIETLIANKSINSMR